jgi:hypothetical protein
MTYNNISDAEKMSAEGFGACKNIPRPFLNTTDANTEEIKWRMNLDLCAKITHCVL